MIASIIQSWMSPALMQRFSSVLLHFVWQGALIAMFAAIALRLSANRSAECRYTVSVAALLLMLAAPVLTFMFYVQTGMATLKLLRYINDQFTTSANQAATTTWTQWIVLAWFIGVLLCSIRLIAGWILSRSLVKKGTAAVPSHLQQSFNEILERLALAKPVRLLSSLHIDTPVAIGWLRPAVLLPIAALTGLSELQLRAVFAHELAHIRRHDFLVNLLQRGVESILFYHPAVWWLSSRIRTEREHCCDDLAVQICGDRSIYAQALIELERVRTVEPDLAVAATGGILTQRIHRVLGYRIVNYDWQSAAAALLFVVVWVTVGSWQSGTTLQARSLAPQPLPSPIVSQSAVTTPKLEGAMNAIAAIATAQPVTPTESVQVGVGNGEIDGILHDVSGKPAAGVNVYATMPRTDPSVSTEGDAPMIVQTDSNGRYRFAEIPPGPYTISAGRFPFLTFYPGSLDSSRSQAVTVAPGAIVRNIDFAMEAPSEGRTAGPKSQPASIRPGSAQQPVLELYVSIQVEGETRVPVFANGHFPKLKLTDVDTNSIYEMWFGSTSITVPLNRTAIPDEYRVAVENLPDGFAVKSITCRADEPGVRLEDVRNQTLKISARAIASSYAGSGYNAGSPDLPIAITLTRTPSAAIGIRVTGSSEGWNFRRQLPPAGGYLPNTPGFINRAPAPLGDAGVYLSGKPGVLYDDGTFEFAGVRPGQHSIILYASGMGSQFAVNNVLVQDRDVAGVKLQAVNVLPKNAFSGQTAAATNTPPGLASFVGKILDENTQQPIAFGTVTLSGYGSTSTYDGPGTKSFEISNLLPGQYSLTVSATGYKPKAQQITIGIQDPPFQITIAPKSK